MTRKNGSWQRWLTFGDERSTCVKTHEEVYEKENDNLLTTKAFYVLKCMRGV